MTTLTVEANDLTRIYGGREAVSDVSFTLSKGEVLGFLGPNGAGKSTTMKMLTGNLAPSKGSVKICGVDMMEHPKEAKALIGYLPETPPLYREFTVDEFLAIAARLHGVSGKHIKTAVQRAKERCGLTEMSKRLIENLSKGYQQRVGIAQAIIHNPMVVILDEPTVGLDPIQIRDIRALIKELGGEHSVILSTHILPEEKIDNSNNKRYNHSFYCYTQARHSKFFLQCRFSLMQYRSQQSLISLPYLQEIQLSQVLYSQKLLRIFFQESGLYPY